MQDALFPMRHLNVTQAYNVGTHIASYAVDLAGKDEGIDNVFAPFDCVVKKVWPNGNTVWFQSIAPVRCADGTIATVTVMMTHDNAIPTMTVGRRFKQGDIIYQEGTAGNATGNHVHLEASKKAFGGTGWHQNGLGYWVINDGAKPESIFLLDDVTIINSGGIAWEIGDSMTDADYKRMGTYAYRSLRKEPPSTALAIAMGKRFTQNGELTVDGFALGFQHLMASEPFKEQSVKLAKPDEYELVKEPTYRKKA